LNARTGIGSALLRTPPVQRNSDYSGTIVKAFAAGLRIDGWESEQSRSECKQKGRRIIMYSKRSVLCCALLSAAAFGISAPAQVQDEEATPDAMAAAPYAPKVVRSANLITSAFKAGT
jgi:hypothetical protein